MKRSTLLPGIEWVRSRRCIGKPVRWRRRLASATVPIDLAGDVDVNVPDDVWIGVPTSSNVAVIGDKLSGRRV